MLEKKSAKRSVLGPKSSVPLVSVSEEPARKKQLYRTEVTEGGGNAEAFNGCFTSKTTGSRASWKWLLYPLSRLASELVRHRAREGRKWRNQSQNTACRLRGRKDTLPRNDPCGTSLATRVFPKKKPSLSGSC